MTSSFCSSTIDLSRRAASFCSSDQRPWRSTKFNAPPPNAPSLGCREMANLVGDLLRHGRRPWRAAPPPNVDFHPEGLPASRRPYAVHGGWPLDAARMRGIEEHEWLGAGRGVLDFLPQQAAILHDRLVCLTEMLAGAVLDRAHRFHCPLIVHVDVASHAGVGRSRLLVRIEAVSVGLVLARAIIRQLIKLEALVAHLVLVDRGRIAGEDRIPIAVLVVDRNVPLRDRHLRAHRYDEAMREKLIGDANMRPLLIDLAQRDQPQPVFGLLDIDDGAIVFAQDFGHWHIAAGGLAAELPAVSA